MNGQPDIELTVGLDESSIQRVDTRVDSLTSKLSKGVQIPVTANIQNVQSQMSSIDTHLDKLRKDAVINIGGNTKEMREVLSIIDRIGASAKSARAAMDFGSSTVDSKRLIGHYSNLNKELDKLSKNANMSNQAMLGISSSMTSVASLGKGFSDVSDKVQKTRLETDAFTKALNALGKTALWSSMNRGFDAMTQKIQESIQYIGRLDESLNQIQLVSGLSADQVARIGVEGNKVARELGQTTTQYTDAAMLYLQQGKSLAESQKMAEATLIATNITGEKSTHVVELLTAAMNGYGYEAGKAMEVLDKFAAVGAATASDFNELAIGFSKVAAMAKTTGVEFDQLNSMIATVASATREAPETIGTSFKTIFARMSSLKLGEDEEGNFDGGATLGRYAAQVKEVAGIDFFSEQTGQLRDMGELVEEVGSKWQDMSKNQKTIIAEAMAGTRQASRLHALFNSWEDYEDTLAVSLDSEGAAMEQNEIRMDSLKVAAARLQASWENLYSKIFNKEQFADFYEGLSSVIDRVSELVEVFGGLGPIVTAAFAPLAGKAIGTGYTKVMQGVRNHEETMLSGTTRGDFSKAALQFNKNPKAMEDLLRGADATQIHNLTGMEIRDIEHQKELQGQLKDQEDQLRMLREVERSQKATAVGAGTDVAKNLFGLGTENTQGFIDAIDSLPISLAEGFEGASEAKEALMKNNTVDTLHKDLNDAKRQVLGFAGKEVKFDGMDHYKNETVLNKAFEGLSQDELAMIGDKMANSTDEAVLKVKETIEKIGLQFEGLEQSLLASDAELDALRESGAITDSHAKNMKTVRDANANVEEREALAIQGGAQGALKENESFVPARVQTALNKLDEANIKAYNKEISDAEKNVAATEKKLSEAKAAQAAAQQKRQNLQDAQRKAQEKAVENQAALDKLEADRTAIIESEPENLSKLNEVKNKITELKKEIASDVRTLKDYDKEIKDAEKQVTKTRNDAAASERKYVDSIKKNIQGQMKTLQTAEKTFANAASKVTQEKGGRVVAPNGFGDLVADSAKNKSYQEMLMSGVQQQMRKNGTADPRATFGNTKSKLNTGLTTSFQEQFAKNNQLILDNLGETLKTTPALAEKYETQYKAFMQAVEKKMYDNLALKMSSIQSGVEKATQTYLTENSTSSDLKRAIENINKTMANKDFRGIGGKTLKPITFDQDLFDANEAKIAQSQNNLNQIKAKKQSLEEKKAQVGISTVEKDALDNEIRAFNEEIKKQTTEIDRQIKAQKTALQSVNRDLAEATKAIQGVSGGKSVDVDALELEAQKARQTLDTLRTSGAPLSAEMSESQAKETAKARQENAEKIARQARQAEIRERAEQQRLRNEAKAAAANTTAGRVDAIRQSYQTADSSSAGAAMTAQTVASVQAAINSLEDGSKKFAQNVASVVRGDMFGKLAQGAIGVSSAITPAVNAFKAFSDGDIENGISGVTMAISAMSFSMGPVGMIVGAISMAAGALLPLLLDNLDATEKIKKHNETIIEQYKEQKGYLQGQKQQLGDLAKGLATAQQNIADAGGINAATEEQKQALYDVQNQIAQLDSSTVAYYDSAGNAVLKHNLNLDEQIEKIDDLILKQDELLVENRENFLSEIISDKSNAEQNLESATTKMAQLRTEMDKMDPTSKKYHQALETISELSAQIAESQDTLANSTKNLSTNVLEAFRNTNSIMRGKDDVSKSFVSGFVTEEAIQGQMNAMADAAKEAEALGMNLEEIGLDAAGQAKQLDEWITAQEHRMEFVNEGLAQVRSDTSEEGKRLAGILVNADQPLKNYVGTLANMTETAQGAASVMRDLASAVNDFGVVSTSFNVEQTLLKASQVDSEALKKQKADAIARQQEAVAAAKPSPYQDRVDAAKPILGYENVPTNASDAMNISSTAWNQGVYMSERENIEHNTVDPAVAAALENRLRVENSITEAINRRAQLMKDEALIGFQMEQARSNYYLDMASTEEGHGRLASTYEQDTQKFGGLYSAAYKEEEQNKYDFNTSAGIAMSPEEQATAKEETVKVSTETDFGEMVDNFDNAISDMLASTEDFGKTFVDEIADAMSMSTEQTKKSIDEMAEVMRGEGMIDALAGTNDEMKDLLTEFAEHGSEASDEAIAAAYEAADAQLQARGEMYAAMRANDAEYWAMVVQANENEVNLTTATTGIKVQDYQTYAEYKAAMRQWEAENASWLANEEVASAVWAHNEQIMDAARKKAEVLRARGDEEGAKNAIAAAETQVQENAENAKIAMAWQAGADIVRAGTRALQIVAENIKKTFGPLAKFIGMDSMLDGIISTIGEIGNGVANDFVNEGKTVINSMGAQENAWADEDTIQSQHNSNNKPGGDNGNTTGGGVDHDIDLPFFGEAPEWSGSKPSVPNTSLGGNNTGGGDGGSGGKSPSSGSEKAPKEQEDMEWEKDWYHDINILIKKNEDALNKLADVEDRTYGEQRIKNMREQARLLQEQYELKKQALAIAHQEAAHYKDLISKQGVSFNEDGSVKNYNDFIQGKVNAANSIADADAKKAAQEDVKELIDDIKKYEDVLFGTIKDYEDEIEKARQEAQDKILEALEYEFEIVIKVKQVIIDDNDFLNDFLEGLETADKTIERLIASGQAQTDALADLGKHFEDVMALDLDPGPKIEKLEELKEEFQDAFMTMKELNEAISEALIDAIDRNIEALDYAFAELEHITSSAQNMIELNNLFGHAEDYDTIGKMMGVIAEANTLQLDTMIKSKEELIEYRDALEEGTEEWKAANDAVLEMDANIQQMTIETIQLYRDQLTNAFEGIMKDIERAMSGNQTLDKMRQDLALLREEQARYADTIDQTIFKQNMLNRIQADIAKTTDPEKQALLQEFYDKQVATLGEKGKLLESELQRTEMLYDITLAQMALDDARANKSMMKLVRDNQGNWGYEYMADMAAIESAQDALTQKLNDLMAFDKAQFEATQDYILQKREEYLVNMRELYEMYLNGEFETEAEYQAAMEALTQEFNDVMLQSEMDYNDLKLNLNQSTLSTLQGELISFSELQSAQWSDLYADVNLKTSEGLGLLEASWEAVKVAINDKILGAEGINKYLNDYATKVDEIAKLTGYDDLKNSSNGLLNASKELATQIASQKTKHEELTNAMKKEFDAIKDLIKPGGAYDQLRDFYKKIQAEVDTYIKKINDAIAKQKELANQKPTTGTPGNGSGSSSGGSSSGSSGSGSGSNPPSTAVGSKVRVKSGRRWYHDSGGMNPSGPTDPYANKDLQVTLNKSGAKYPLNVGSKSGEYLGWLRKEDIVGYETGGYTGAFGNQGGPDGKAGKLAMLHEKELVLNKQDTVNMLAAISMVRDIYTGPKVNLSGASGGLQQTVHINADFSGVRNSAEIENAFENLLNKAIQYTSAKK